LIVIRGLIVINNYVLKVEVYFNEVHTYDIVIGLGLAVTQGGLSTKPLRDGTRACLRRAMPLSGAHKRLSVDNPPRNKSLSAPNLPSRVRHPLPAPSPEADMHS